MRLYDGTCRGNDAGKIYDLLPDSCCRTVGDIGNRIGRGTAYVRSRVSECIGLEFVIRPRLVREWTVRRKETFNVK